MEEALRSALLSLAKNRGANRLARMCGLRLGAGRFVAGETIEAAIARVRALNGENLAVTLDHLGESVRDASAARAAKDHCLRALDAVAAAGVDATLSVKLTQLGLDVNADMCRGHMREILACAGRHGNFVQIDMEDYSHCQATVELALEMFGEFSNVGAVVQAYLYRAAEDAERMAKLGMPLRIVKGAYREPPAVAFPQKADVDDNYRRLVAACLAVGAFTAIATHDEAIVNWARSHIDRSGIARDRFEFQMLYGIRPALQRAIAQAGHRVRIYVPYGTDWYGYFMRRLAERPANIGFILRSVIGRS